MAGLTNLNKQYQAIYGHGDYLPPVEAIYWSMRGMAYAARSSRCVAVVGAFLLWKRRLERLRWFLWVGVCATVLPFLACIAGWCLTEIGRQPWIVQGLLTTDGANSPNVSTTWLAISLAVFVTLYVALLVVDFWLMRRYAGATPVEQPTTRPAPPRRRSATD